MFSSTPGGLANWLFRSTKLSRAFLEWPSRRIIFLVAITWLPLLLLTLQQNRQSSTGTIPFLSDIEVHIRFLISLPLLLGAERAVHGWLHATVRQFLERNLIAPGDLPRFQSAENAAERFRGSFAVELLLLLAVGTAGVWIWRNQIDVVASSWYRSPDAGFTPAGLWYIFISIPFFQFFLGRWYIRILVWAWFLWKVSRLPLALNPLHTDRAGGLRFLGQGSYAFAPFLFAHGAVLSGVIAKRVLFLGQSLDAFRIEALSLVSLSLVFVLGPLALFMPMLVRARWQGELEYGRLMNDVVRLFHRKWIGMNAPLNDHTLQQQDFSALTDLGSSYSSMTGTRIVPFGLEDVTWLVMATAAPLLPLVLTAFTFDELFVKVLHFFF